MKYSGIWPSERDRTTLAVYLGKEIERAAMWRDAFERKWKYWEKQYNGRLEREDAGPMDAHIDIPITREYAQQTRSRILNPIFQRDHVFIATPREPQQQEFARSLGDFFDHATDLVELEQVCDNWFRASQVFNAGFAKIVVQKDKKVVDVQHVPTDDIFFPPEAHGIDESKWFAHCLWMSMYEVRERIKTGFFRKEAEKIAKPETERVNRFAAEAAKEEEERGYLTSPDTKDRAGQYQVLEVYIDWKFSGDDDSKEYIVWFDRVSKTICRIVENEYETYKRPFEFFAYEESETSIYGIPQAFILEPVHRAYSASICQRLDAASKANEVVAIGKEGGDLGEIFKDGRLKGGYYETSSFGNLKEELITFAMSQPFTQLPELETVLERHAQMVSNIAPLNFGMDPTQRPTASGQIAQIKEAQMPLFRLLDRFRKKLARVGMILLARYKQFFPEIYEFYVPDIGELRHIEWPEGQIEDLVVVDTEVSSATMNRDLLKQERLALVDKLPQVFKTMMEMAQMASQPPPLGMVASLLLKSYQEVVGDWLAEFGVDQDKVKTDVSEVFDDGKRVAEVLKMLQGRIRELEGKLAAISGQPGSVPGAQPVGPGPGAGLPAGPPAGMGAPAPMVSPGAGAMPPGGPVPPGGPPGIGGPNV